MISDSLNQQTLSYLEEFGPANLPDPQLPAEIREMLAQNSAQTAIRIKNAESEEWELVLLTAPEVQAARSFSMSLEDYAARKRTS